MWKRWFIKNDLGTENRRVLSYHRYVKEKWRNFYSFHLLCLRLCSVRSWEPARISRLSGNLWLLGKLIKNNQHLHKQLVPLFNKWNIISCHWPSPYLLQHVVKCKWRTDEMKVKQEVRVPHMHLSPTVSLLCFSPFCAPADRYTCCLCSNVQSHWNAASLTEGGI